LQVKVTVLGIRQKDILYLARGIISRGGGHVPGHTELRGLAIWINCFIHEVDQYGGEKDKCKRSSLASDKVSLYDLPCLIRFIWGPTDKMVALLTQFIQYSNQFKLRSPLVPTPYADGSM
jgi:hypothetical protein